MLSPILSGCVSIHQSIKSRVETRHPSHRIYCPQMSLSINPSNQGLKPSNSARARRSRRVSIHQSIKSRVETKPPPLPPATQEPSLSINPSNQGLKQRKQHQRAVTLKVSIHQSIKSRVETRDQKQVYSCCQSLYPSIHQIKG